MRQLLKRSLPAFAAFSSLAAFGGEGGSAPLFQVTPPQPSAGLLNDFLRENSLETKAWDLGGQERVRFEYREYGTVSGAGANAVDFRATTPQRDNAYLLFRSRAHIGYTPYPGFTAYVEAQNSASLWDQRNPNPENDAGVDLRQAYVALGDPSSFPLTLKVGRQELVYGDGRLVSQSDWNNLGRTFEAAKLRWEREESWVEAFTGRVIIPNDNNWNQPNWFELFSGFYASSRSYLPGLESQLYFFADNASQKSGTVKGTGVNGDSPRDIYTLGIRVKSLPDTFKQWDFEVDAAGQLGDFQYATNTPGVVNGQRLDHQAWAAHLAGGYTFTNLTWQPRLGLAYNYATGDSNPTDGKHGTFVNLFPTNHKFYGFMDFFAWQNMHDLHFMASARPLTNLTVQLEYHAFWLATTSDFFYQAHQQPRTTGGYGINPGAGSFVGQEVDLVASYRLKTWGAFELGGGHFFVGDYPRDTFANLGGAKGANWFYAQARLSF